MGESRKGVRVRLSPARKMVVELLRHARKVPSLPLKRRLDVARLAAARAACPARPSWVGLFLKAYGLVAQGRPELRRAYIPFPWPHLYEHPVSECTVLVEREWDGEKGVLAAKIRNCEAQPLRLIDEFLRRVATARFGTFMVSTLGNHGVEQGHPLTPLTTYLSFGPIGPAGDVTAMIVYDHRVMDGRSVALALTELEAALNGPILAEVESLARAAA